MTNKEEIRKQTYTSARFYETTKVEIMQSESIINTMNYKEVKYMGHHKHHNAKRCKYHPTVENHEKILFSTDKIIFCEQLKAFPIGRRR